MIKISYFYTFVKEQGIVLVKIYEHYTNPSLIRSPNIMSKMYYKIKENVLDFRNFSYDFQKKMLKFRKKS